MVHTQLCIEEGTIDELQRRGLSADIDHLRHLIEREQQEWVAKHVHAGLLNAPPSGQQSTIALRLYSLEKNAQGRQSRENFEWEWRNNGWLEEQASSSRRLQDRISD